MSKNFPKPVTMRRTLTLILFSLFFVPLAQGQVVFESNFNGFPTVLEKTFSDSSLTSGGWITKDVVGAEAWDTSYAGVYNVYGVMNGYSGSPQDNEDWFISPSLDGTQGLYLEFRNAKNYSGPPLELLVSTDYDGSSAPSTASWDTLSFNRSSGNWNWANSGTIDLTTYNDPDIYFAFLYTSSPAAGAATWEVDDIKVTKAPNKWFGSKTSIESDSISHFAFGVNYGNAGIKMVNEDTAHRRLSTKPMMLNKGQTYEVSYWTRGNGSVRAGLYDGDASDGDYGYSYAQWNYVGAGTNWTKKSDTLTADTTNANGEFILSVNFTEPTMHVQFDSVVISKQSIALHIATHSEASSKELEVFPNPASERIHVRSKGYGMDLSVDLLDATGRVVRTRSSEASTRFNINVQDLDAGVYFLRLRNGTESAQRKVLVR